LTLEQRVWRLRIRSNKARAPPRSAADIAAVTLRSAARAASPKGSGPLAARASLEPATFFGLAPAGSL
jgi:hypothetical protein